MPLSPLGTEKRKNEPNGSLASKSSDVRKSKVESPRIHAKIEGYDELRHSAKKGARERGGGQNKGQLRMCDSDEEQSRCDDQSATDPDAKRKWSPAGREHQLKQQSDSERCSGGAQGSRAHCYRKTVTGT